MTVYTSGSLQGPELSAGALMSYHIPETASILLTVDAFNAACEEQEDKDCSSSEVIFTQYTDTHFFQDGECAIASPVLGATVNGLNSTKSRDNADIVEARFTVNPQVSGVYLNI